MDIRLDGKRALVTGAGKGIGRAIAKGLMQCGAETYALSRTQSDLNSLKDEEPGIHVLQVDLANWEETKKVVESIGPIDCLVNNAGTSILESVLEVSHDALQTILDVNLKAAVNVSQVVAKGMVDRGNGGSIVNVSSQCSQVALQYHLSYCASKAALDAVTRVMALELGPHRIRVNSVNPTVVLTPMGRMAWGEKEKAAPMLAKIPLGKFAEEHDVVHPVLYLLSDKSDMITGAALPVDGGFLAC